MKRAENIRAIHQIEVVAGGGSTGISGAALRSSKDPGTGFGSSEKVSDGKAMTSESAGGFETNADKAPLPTLPWPVLGHL